MNAVNMVQDQEYINRLYTELENIDPECRNGEVRILSSDTPEIKEQKELRIKKYGIACEKLREISTARVERICSYYGANPQKALSHYPENKIPESNNPMLSLKAYQELCAQIYSKNQQKIDEFVETRYWDRKKFPGAITLDSIKTGFRLVFGNQLEPRPHIIIGWDLENPHIFYIEADWVII